LNENRLNKQVDRSGFDDFRYVLSNFRVLSAAGLGTSIVVPFVAYVANVMPPLTGIVLITALVEIVTLVLVFQLFRSKPKRAIDKMLTRTVVLLFAASAVYLVCFVMVTFQKGSSTERGVRGFICESKLSKEMAAGCPSVSREHLQKAEWDPYQVWVEWTVDLNLALLTLLWLACFLLLSFSIGTFLVYQTRVPGKVRP
jgi:hypothetical protein